VKDDVTVVIPTRHRPDLLATTLHSVQVAVDEARRAGWRARVLVVDDASEDEGTREAAQAARVGYVRVPEHDGRNNPASAIILGVSAVETPYLTLFGDDDIMLPRYLVAHLEKLAPGFDLCSGSYVKADGKLHVLNEVILPEPHLGDLLGGRIVINDGAMVRTELMQAAPWDAGLGQQVLYPVWLTILTGGARVTTVPEVTWLYRRHEGNISDQLSEQDAAQRLAVSASFKQAYIDRGERVPPSREQVLRDEIEARAAQARRAAQAKWDATPWPRKMAIRIRRRARRLAGRTLSGPLRATRRRWPAGR
jgi:glycosyltransferase involved in cell wall biosynthesis